MEKYIIYYNEGTSNKKYIQSIYRSSLSTSNDIGDAIEFNSKELALKMQQYLIEREKTNIYKIMCIKTTIEEVVE